MPRLTLTQHIQAPARDVFETATDFARAHDTVQAIKRVEMLTDGPTRVGTRFRETRTVFRRDATEEMMVSAFQPHERFALAAESHGCRFHTVFELLPLDEGTEVRMTFEACPQTTVARVMGFLMKPMMRSVARQCGQDLLDLKRSVEGRQGGG